MELCPICKGALHVRLEGSTYERCPCLNRDLERLRLKSLSKGGLDKVQITSSVLESFLTKSVRVQATAQTLKRHVAYLMNKDKSLSVMGRGVYSFLQDNLDEESSTWSKMHSMSLLIIMMDEAMENRFIPSLLTGVVQSRSMREKGTWLVMSYWDVGRLMKRFDPADKHNHTEFRLLLDKMEEVSV